MEGVSGIQGVNGGQPPTLPAAVRQAGVSSNIAEAGGSAPAKSGNGPVVPAGSQENNVAALSTFSLQQSATMLSITEGPQGAIVSNELLGAILLLLILEYMQSSDSEEKKGLLALAMVLAQSQTEASGGARVDYASTSLSIESTQLLLAGPASNAYTNAGANPAGGADAGAGGVDVTA